MRTRNRKSMGVQRQEQVATGEIKGDIGLLPGMSTMTFASFHALCCLRTFHLPRILEIALSHLLA